MDRERILEYRDESQRLDQCGRLYDSSVSNEGFALDASHIVQVLFFSTVFFVFGVESIEKLNAVLLSKMFRFFIVILQLNDEHRESTLKEIEFLK